MTRTEALLEKLLRTYPDTGVLSRNTIQELTGCTEYESRSLAFVLAHLEVLRKNLQAVSPEGTSSSFETTASGDIIIENPVSSSIEELMRRFDLDPEYWSITKSIINEWGSRENFNRQAKAWLTRRGDIIDWNTFKSDFLEFVRDESPAVPRIHYPEAKSGKLLELNIFDLHLGKLAWAPESGESYDSKIAQDRFFGAIQALCIEASHFRVERILFPIGNDFFNTDGSYPYPHTTAGTPQEDDIRWQKSYKLGRVMITTAIDMLKQVAPVDVVVIPGNHDFQKSFYLGDAVEMRYENDQNVTVDNSPRNRKYYQYGLNLIGFTHGRRSDTPIDRLLLLMPQEAPDLWASTKYREWHMGDIHHTKKLVTRQEEDVQGIKLKYFRSLKSKDSWEDRKGYLSLGGAEALLWDRYGGHTASFYYNL